MIAIPSSRRLAHLALIFLAIVTILRLCIAIIPSNRKSMIDQILLKSHKGSFHTLTSNPYLDHEASLEDAFVKQYHESNPLQKPNPLSEQVFSRCTHEPNLHTNHIRLPSVRIHNISMVPSDNLDDSIKDNKYFNPAIIPLPSYVFTSSAYRYLLISRLVTSGSHQESHICFADICMIDTTVSYGSSGTRSGTRSCTPSDLEALGPHGGIRCITKPEKVNIPPTPSKKCTGAWATFPDIPGFHDPRVFWSGRGEPLIEVNSGSVYGCIGLWMVDLRAIFPVLHEVLKKRDKDKELRADAGTETDSKSENHKDMDLTSLGARMGYPHLTEITRNPRSSRSEVEKNWILFFPTEEEMWVQYDMMGKSQSHESERPRGLTGDTTLHSSVAPANITVTDSSEDSIDVSTAVTKALFDTMEADQADHVAVAVFPSTPKNVLEFTSLPSPIADEQDIAAGPAKRAEAEPGMKVPPAPLASELGRTQTTSSTGIQSDILQVQETQDAADDSLLPATTSSPGPSSAETLDTPATTDNSPSSRSGGRSLAQVSSHGHTTPNLTSPHESSCFDLTSYDHLHDGLNNIGHWHQGSNSLRLVLCTREDFRARSCIPQSQSAREGAAIQDHKTLDWFEYETLLLREGLIVHVSVVHRKFSNFWDLPMRYERYFLVWEARKPFRTLGVSRYPVLFGEERARPWSAHEDGTWDLWQDRDKAERGGGRKARNDAEQEKDNNAYFTYTPSIAWAWREKSEDQTMYMERGHEALGTGYLGEEVIIGLGMDDTTQAFVKVKVDELLGCMRMCPER